MFGILQSFQKLSTRFSQVRSIVTASHSLPFRSILSPNSTSIVAPLPGGILNAWALGSVRTNVRNHFPYPRETKRVKTHGWKKRMSTPGGRKVIMRRILKGRHVLSH